MVISFKLYFPIKTTKEPSEEEKPNFSTELLHSYHKKPNYKMTNLKIFAMFAIVAVALPLSIQGAALNAKAAVSRRDFIYLGTFNNPRITIHGATIKSSSEYYMSSNNAQYESAARDCEDLFEASLVNIETEEELRNLTEKIDGSGNAATRYWSGGRWDASAKRWVWSNDVPVGPWAPWEGGKLPVGTRMSRVLLKLANGLEFSSQFNTLSERYICEIKLDGEGGETEPEPCYDDNDLVIAVDSSGSIGAANYEIALEFASKLAYTWADSKENRISVVIYSSVAETIIPLDTKLSQQEIRDLTHNARYMNSGTNSHLGLDMSRGQIESNPRTAVPKNIVFMTDGGAGDKPALQTAVNNVKAAGIRTFAVGIGAGIVQSELKLIALGLDKHVFTTDQFDELLTLLRSVSRAICAK